MSGVVVVKQKSVLVVKRSGQVIALNACVKLVQNIYTGQAENIDGGTFN